MSRGLALAVALAPLSAPVTLAWLPAAAQAQTMYDQERRLIDIHSLLLDLPPSQAPGGLSPGQVSVGLELVAIPVIDGTTGSKEQITASDRTRLFPRPRLAIGLPLGGEFRAFVGGAYIPPIPVRQVATHDLSLEAGVAWVPGTFRAALRLHGLYARSTAPVTDPSTRDTLLTTEGGADLAVGAIFHLGRGATLEPWASGGVVALHGKFQVESDGNVLESDHVGPAFDAGLRLLTGGSWEAVAEVVGYPDRLVHPNFRVGYVFR